MGASETMPSSNISTNDSVQVVSSLASDFFETLPCVTASLIAIPANVLIIVCLWKDGASKTSAFNIYTTFVALADLLVGVMAPVRVFLAYVESWPFGWTACILWKVFDLGLCTVTKFLFLAVGYDRYRCVTAPLQYRSEYRKHRATKVSLALWCLGFGLWLPFIFMKLGGADDRESCPYLATSTEYLDIIQLLFAYIIPLVLLIVMNSVLVLTLKRQSKIPRVQSRKSSQGRLTLPGMFKWKTPSSAHTKETDAADRAVLSSLCCVPRLTNTSETQIVSSSEPTIASDDCERENEITFTASEPGQGSKACNYSVGTLDTTPPMGKPWSDTTTCSGLSNVSDNGCKAKAVVRNNLPVTRRLKASRNSSANKVLLMVMAFLLFWLPIFVAWPVNIACGNCVPRRLMLVFVNLVFCQSAANPVVLILCSSRIRAQIVTWFGCLVKEK